MAPAQILVVEDENIIALDIQNRLKTLGYSVPTIASSGAEALQKAAAWHPDLALMDIVLKGDMDGIDTAERLVVLNVPVVYLTAYADAQTLQRAKTTGPFGYILKPFTDSQLQSTIEVALHKHRLDQQIAHERLAAKKLEALGTLAGGIAYEFNNLLTTITQEPLFTNLTAAAQASQQAAEVTQRLLTFAKSGAPASLPPQEVVSPPPAAGRHKILVMDDEEIVRATLTQMLIQLGYAVESARDGVEAIQLYRRAKDVGQPFAAVLMDLTIAAGMGGKETIAELRQVDPEVKAIVSSGNANDPVMTNFQQYGFRGVLAKPYPLAELQAMLQNVIGGQSGECNAGVQR